MSILTYCGKIAIGVIATIVIFIAFQDEPFDNYNTWHDLFTLESVSNRIGNSIKNDGVGDTIILYAVKAPIFEEIVYRGPLWFLCVMFGLLGFNYWVRNVVLWPSLILPTLSWSLHHPYPPIYQPLIFIGGVMNGAIIIYLLEKKWSKTSVFGSLALVICAHSLLNILFILFVLITL
ncbi:MAG: CPBP family glutamic-type intramembrane protease [Patescibacteria group bacterium]